MRCKRGRCVGLTTLPKFISWLSWNFEPQLPRIPRACPGIALSLCRYTSGEQNSPLPAFTLQRPRYISKHLRKLKTKRAVLPWNKAGLGENKSICPTSSLTPSCSYGSLLFTTTPLLCLPQIFLGTGCSSTMYWLLWSIILCLWHEVFSTETSYFFSPMRLSVSKELNRADSTRWFKYDRDWFVCKQAALRSSCATLREWSHNLHPLSCSG